MRILVVGSMYPPLFRGGYELLCEGVVRLAVAEGHRVRVLVSDHAAGAGVEDSADVHRDLRSYWDWTDERPTTTTLRERVALERHNNRVLARHLDAFRPDVVSWWQMGAVSLSLPESVRRRGLPAVLTVLDEWPVYGPETDAWARLCRRLGPAAPVVERLVGVPARIDLGAAGRFLFISAYVRDRVARAGVAAKDADTVPAGIHERFLAGPDPGPWADRLLYVGRLDRRKGVDIAIDALRDLPPSTTLRIAGTGSPEAVAEATACAAAAGARDRVTLSAVEADRMPAAYAGADAVVFPPRWEEPFGLVPLEAMGMNRPVVAVATGGAAEYLRDGVNALIVPAGDPAAVAAAVLRLKTDPQLRDRLRTGGLRTARAYTAARFERRIVDEIVRAAG